MGEAVGNQVLRGERLGMVHVGIEREDQGRALLNESHAGMAAAVNPPFVALRFAEPTLQVQIVLGQLRDGAYE